MYPDFKDAEALESVDDKIKGGQLLADDITKRVALRLVANCNKFKQPRLDKIQKYRDIYAGKVAAKFRQPFSVVLPVFGSAYTDQVRSSQSARQTRLRSMWR